LLNSQRQNNGYIPFLWEERVQVWGSRESKTLCLVLNVSTELHRKPSQAGSAAVSLSI